MEGFGFSKDTGAFANGVLMGADAAGWLDFAGKSVLQSFVESGFSGAPLFDETEQAILGMVVTVHTEDGKRLASAQSTSNLWEACPQLANPYPGLVSTESPAIHSAKQLKSLPAARRCLLFHFANAPMLAAKAATSSNEAFLS